MERDYAKRSHVSYQKKRPNLKWLVLAIIIVVFIVGIIGYVVVQTKNNPEGKQQASEFLAKIKHLFSRHVTEVPTAVKKVEATPEPQVRFSFYNELPNLHVEIPAQQQVSTPPPQQAVDHQNVSPEKPLLQASYFLQFGMFRESSGASRLRLSLLLTGIETEVESLQTPHGKMYRVWQGPYTELAIAKQYQQKWLKKGIETNIRKKDNA